MLLRQCGISSSSPRIYNCFNSLFSHQCLLSDSKFPQITRTLLSILADLKKCCGLYGLDPSFDFQFSLSPFKEIGDRSKCIKYNWYYRHPHNPHVFQRSGKIKIVFFSSLIFAQLSAGTTKSSR